MINLVFSVSNYSNYCVTLVLNKSGTEACNCLLQKKIIHDVKYEDEDWKKRRDNSSIQIAFHYN